MKLDLLEARVTDLNLTKRIESIVLIALAAR